MRNKSQRPTADQKGAEPVFGSAPKAPGPGVREVTSPSVPYVTAAQMSEVDRRASGRYGIRLIQMMELAGRNLAEQTREMQGGSVVGREIVVLCGVGNNGGGGMVSARLLHGWGARVRVVLVGTEHKLKPVPKRQWNILKRLGLTVGARAHLAQVPLDFLIDAIFGYGFHGRPRPVAARWIGWTNAQDGPILALDVPSGLDATTGKPGRLCIRATATLSLALPKTGLRVPQAVPYVGKVYLADIGIPVEVYRDMGMEVSSPFERGPIVRLSESWER